MTIKVKESGRLEEIIILDFDYGSEWTADYIGACMYELDEDDHIIMSEEEYIYWSERAKEYDEIKELREALDNEELFYDLSEEAAGYGEIEDAQGFLIELLREALGMPKNRYVVVSLYPEWKREKYSHCHSEWIELVTDDLEEAKKEAAWCMNLQLRNNPSDRMEIEIRRQDGIDYDVIELEEETELLNKIL